MGPSDLGGTYFVKAELDDLWRGSGLECTGEMDKVQEELLDCWRSIVTYARSKLRYIQRPGLPQPFTFTQLKFTTIDTSRSKVHAQNGIYASTVQPAGSRGSDHVLREKFAHKALLLQVRNDDNLVCSNDTAGEALLGKFIESNE